MVPLRDHNPTEHTPYLTYGLITLNVVVFFHQLTLDPSGLAAFFQEFAIVPQEVSQGFAQNDWWYAPQGFPEILTFISSQFLHGGWLHLGGNMLFLWVFGNNIEDKLGPVKYLGFYLGCGVLAGVSQYGFDLNSAVPCVGASGAIAGVMGAYVLRFPKAQIVTLIPLGFMFTTIQLPAFVFLGFWFVQQAIASVGSLGVATESGGVAYWAHAGGFVFGMVLGPLLGLMDSK